MRVLMITNMYPHEDDPSFGTFVYEQVRALRELGLEIDVLFINGRSSRWNYLLGFARLWRQLHHVSYDVLHAHYVFTGWIARAQRRHPVVVSFHAPGESETYQGWLCRRLAPWVDAKIVTSEDHGNRLGFDDAYVIPCGVDLDLFRPQEKGDARAALGWEAERPIVAWVGDPRREKRLDLAVAAMEPLARRWPSAELKVVTKVPHGDVPMYMNAADVLVLTSDHEGSPVVIKEAMACNLPIVSRDVGDVAQVIADVDGCFLAEGTPESLAEQLDRALDFGRRTEGRGAIRHLQTSGEARRILEVYHGVLLKHESRRAS